MVPNSFIEKFTTRRAFTYMLEILAGVMAVVYRRLELPKFFIMMVDNQAGRSALQKGFGKDQRVNSIIQAFWALASHEGWFPIFQYVKSELNISDPISRFDTTDAEKLGWSKLDIDTTGLLETLESFAQDPNDSISDLLTRLVSPELTPCGVEVCARCGDEGSQPPAATGIQQTAQLKTNKRVRVLDFGEVHSRQAHVLLSCRHFPGVVVVSSSYYSSFSSFCVFFLLFFLLLLSVLFLSLSSCLFAVVPLVWFFCLLSGSQKWVGHC